MRRSTPATGEATHGIVAVCSTTRWLVAGTSAADANDFLVYDQSTGSPYYDPDGSGATAKTLFAVLEGGPALGASDFLVT
jgi:Ca2+-binding RTX toxin-like protein